MSLRLTALILPFVVLPATACAQTPAASTSGPAFEVDMSAVDLFWSITDVLARDEAPDSAAWRALFATPAYAALQNDERIRSNIELVFRPSNAARLDSTYAQANYWRRRDLDHLIHVRETKAELRDYQATLDIDRAIRQGIAEASVFLAEGAADEPPPPIRFVIFSPDARVMRGNIIFDLAYTRGLGFDLLAKVMGHEFHHFLVDTRLRLPEPTSAYFPLLRAIRQLQVEGVADLVDKPTSDSLRAGDPDWQQQFRAPFATTTERLAALDTMLVELAGDTARLVEHGNRALNELFPMGGHPNGYAMARLIEEVLGREAIIGALDNPFEFFRSYDRAARASGRGHAFSSAALAYLAELEQMFVEDE
jgi:hypothetical protein